MQYAQHKPGRDFSAEQCKRKHPDQIRNPRHDQQIQIKLPCIHGLPSSSFAGTGRIAAAAIAPISALIMMIKPSERKLNKRTYLKTSPVPIEMQIARTTPLSAIAPGIRIAINIP